MIDLPEPSIFRSVTCSWGFCKVSSCSLVLLATEKSFVDESTKRVALYSWNSFSYDTVSGLFTIFIGGRSSSGRLVRAPEFEPCSRLQQQQDHNPVTCGSEPSVIRTSSNFEPISNNKTVADPCGPATFHACKGKDGSIAEAIANVNDVTEDLRNTLEKPGVRAPCDTQLRRIGIHLFLTDKGDDCFVDSIL